MGHHHHHHHHHVDPQAGDRQVAMAVGVNLALTVVQIVGGIVSGSIALIADAIHNLSDAVSLIIAFWARKIARKPADARMTFGYGRAEMVAALVNYTTLIVISVYLAFEGVNRLIDPPDIQGWTVVIVAGFALVVDLLTALLTLRLSKESANIRAAFIHNLSDALGSVAVIVGGILVLLYDWRLVDPIITLMIAAYILYLALTEIGGVVRNLMLGAPSDLDTLKILAQIEEVEGVHAAHHLHLWQLTEHDSALQVHLVVADPDWDQAMIVRGRVRDILHGAGIAHVTLEVERASAACPNPARIGQGALT